MVVDKGRIVSEGTPQEIKNQGASRTIRCRTVISRAQLWELAGVINVQQEGDLTIVTAGNPESVVRHMLLADETLSGLEIISPGLEDAFLALTSSPR